MLLFTQSSSKSSIVLAENLQERDRSRSTNAVGTLNSGRCGIPMFALRNRRIQYEASLKVYCTMPRKLKIVVAHHEKVIADTLVIILRQSNADAVAAYSGTSALDAVLTTDPDLAILCIVPAFRDDLNGVY